MILLYNAQIINEGRQWLGYVVIDGENIALVGEGFPDEHVRNMCSEQHDLNGKYLLPGAIDDQVHFRDPGLTHKADIATESAAAVAGGVTSFMDMPNTNPQTVTQDALEAKYERAAAVSHANYSFYIGATNDNISDVLRTDFSKVCGVKAFLGSSTGNMLINNSNSLLRLFSEVDAIIAIHSEDEEIINANRQRFVAKYGDDLPVQYHPLIRSAEACYECTARAVDLADRRGTRLHVLHLSTEKEMSLFSSNPLEDKRITAEVCVHHLWFTDADYATLGNRIKCNPAVKTLADREALRNALRSGRIDIAATDHAPHLLSEKEGNCLKAASGMPLVQYSLVAMLEMAREGIFSYCDVVDYMCHKPAKLFAIRQRGFIRQGFKADLAIVEALHNPYTVSDADVVSRCGWT
ncbi:MAG: dihydroorotase, partial [Muribaculaceae bacterium]|nr:dihydroorotase [Muribaculaceae bacterium]